MLGASRWNKSKRGIFSGLLVAIVVSHVLWVCGVYPSNSEDLLRLAVIVLTLLTASVCLKIEKIEKGADHGQDIVALGLALLAFNMYFVRFPEINIFSVVVGGVAVTGGWARALCSAKA